MFLRLSSIFKRLALLSLLTLLAPLLFVACGDETLPTSVAQNQAAPLATAIPTEPSPTPAPVPIKLVLGDDDNLWGEITRYQPTPNERTEEVALTSEVSKGLKVWFDNAAKLAPAVAAAGTQNMDTSYLLNITQDTAKKLVEGTISSKDLGTAATFILGSGAKVLLPKIVTAGSVAFPPAAVASLVAASVSALAIGEINSQFNKANKNLSDIKSLLEETEYGKLTGNLNYLNTMRVSLNTIGISPADLEIFRAQLETIERETFQLISALDARTERIAKTFSETKLDKSFVVFMNDKKVEELRKLVTDYRNQSNNYMVALQVRGLAAQIGCVLPGRRDLALSRIEDVQIKLADWNSKQSRFFYDASSRASEMSGLFSDSKVPEAFRELTKTSSDLATANYNTLSDRLTLSLRKVRGQIDDLSKPLQLVAELDTNGNVKRIIRLIK